MRSRLGEVVSVTSRYNSSSAFVQVLRTDGRTDEHVESNGRKSADAAARRTSLEWQRTPVGE